MLVPRWLLLSRNHFNDIKPDSLPPESHQIAVLSVLINIDNTVKWLRIIRRASISGCFGDLVIAQIVHHQDDSVTVKSALDKAKIATALFCTMGPVPPQIPASVLQSVLATEAPSIKILALKEQSAKFYVTSGPDLENLLSIESLMPNHRLQIRARDESGSIVSLTDLFKAEKSADSTPDPSMNPQQQSSHSAKPKQPSRQDADFKRKQSASTGAAKPAPVKSQIHVQDTQPDPVPACSTTVQPIDPKLCNNFVEPHLFGLELPFFNRLCRRNSRKPP
jgi:hypothetical protein